LRHACHVANELRNNDQGSGAIAVREYPLAGTVLATSVNDASLPQAP